MLNRVARSDVRLPFLQSVAATDDARAFGYEFARHTMDLMEVLGPEGEAQYEALDDIMNTRDAAVYPVRRERVHAWYQLNFSETLSLVPKGAPRKEFLDGIFAAKRDGVAF